MSKYTTTLEEIIVSELYHAGHNPYFNNNQMTFFDDDFQFLKKIMFYDDDVHKIVTKKFFVGFEFSNEYDKVFKKAWINKFYDFEIAFQTMELFASKNIHLTLSLEKYISELYGNIDSYLSNTYISETIGNDLGVSDNRTLDSELPQDNINLNVNDTILDYGTRNYISRNKNENNKTSQTTNKNYNLDNLEKIKNMYTWIFDQYQKKCFLGVW